MANRKMIARELSRSLNSFEFEKSLEISDNEAKTRMYLVEPFFEMLGFNRGFENGHLIPEYNADFAGLNGKKVDYAITFRGRAEIVVEVKKSTTKLSDRHLRQLNEYFFNTKESKIGILTNGVEFNFCGRDENGGGGLNPSPFYNFNLDDVDSASLEQLAKFHATAIDVDSLISEAQELFFVDAFEDALYHEFKKPSTEFVKAIYTRMGGLRLTSGIEKQIKDLVNSVSVKAALDRLVVDEAGKANSGVITTDEELKVYHIIKTILVQNRKIDASRIGYRDMKGKFSILIDDNQRKKVCDLKISPTKRKIEIDGVSTDIPDLESILSLKSKLTNSAISHIE